MTLQVDSLDSKPGFKIPLPKYEHPPETRCPCEQ
jgi:hypothetical protein